METELKRFDLHPAQIRLWKADETKRILVGIAGAQGGKTSFGCLWMINQWWESQDRKMHGANYVIVAPTYKILEQSIIPTWMKFSGHLKGQLNKADATFTYVDGGKLFFRTATDPDSVIGTPNVRAAWIDECGKVGRASYYAVLERIARLQGKLLLTTTPYSLNWVAREVIMPAERGERKDILYVRWRSVDNPSFPPAAYEEARARLPARIFRMRYEGFHDKAEGLIHADWDDLNWVDGFQLPEGTKYYGGVDWGWDHPFALSVRGVTPDGEMYGVSIFKKSGLSTMQQVDLIQQKTKLFHVELWLCGHDRPDMIAELQNRGIAAVKYFEFNKNLREVIAGDQKLSELIKAKRYRVFRNIDQWQELEEEYQTYVWDRDLDDDDRGREKPVDENNDLMAAERYVTCGTVHLIKEPVFKLAQPVGVQAFRDEIDLRGKKRGHWSAY